MSNMNSSDLSIKRLRWLAWCGDEGRRWFRKNS